ncbi:MAG: hypothetical protein OXI30_19720 [Chloroflexota bacterium]|nr:hypothetical protein [Chloroflexota bacterium]
METLMLIGLFLFSMYTVVLVSVVSYDVLTGRINRLRGIAHSGSNESTPLSTQGEA